MLSTLHVAACNNSLRTVEVLAKVSTYDESWVPSSSVVQAGVEIDILNEQNRSAYSIARSEVCRTICTVLGWVLLVPEIEFDRKRCLTESALMPWTNSISGTNNTQPYVLPT